MIVIHTCWRRFWYCPSRLNTGTSNGLENDKNHSLLIHSFMPVFGEEYFQEFHRWQILLAIYLPKLSAQTTSWAVTKTLLFELYRLGAAQFPVTVTTRIGFVTFFVRDLYTPSRQNSMMFYCRAQWEHPQDTHNFLARLLHCCQQQHQPFFRSGSGQGEGTPEAVV